MLGTLADPSSQVRQTAESALREFGATVTELEDGGLAALAKGEVLAFTSGPTTRQSREPSHIPLLTVRGPGTINYLRMGAADPYHDGRWSQLDPVEEPFERLEPLEEVAGRVLRGSDRPPPPKSSIAPHLGSNRYWAIETGLLLYLFGMAAWMMWQTGGAAVDI